MIFLVWLAGTTLGVVCVALALMITAGILAIYTTFPHLRHDQRRTDLPSNKTIFSNPYNASQALGIPRLLVAAIVIGIALSVLLLSKIQYECSDPGSSEVFWSAVISVFICGGLLQRYQPMPNTLSKDCDQE